MKIALFAAVKEEVNKIHKDVYLTGIGREMATMSTLAFMEKHKHEDFVILNLGTVGSKHKPVGDILRISEIISGGLKFCNEKFLTHRIENFTNVNSGVLFSSDCFVSPSVYSADFLEEITTIADCFDMESSAVYSIAKHYGIPFVSYKIVSDNLDVDPEEWQKRVHLLSDNLCDFAMNIITELDKEEKVELLHF